MKHILIAALALSTGLAFAQQCPQGSWEPGFWFGNDQSSGSDAIEAIHLIHIFDGIQGRFIALPAGEAPAACSTLNARLWTPPDIANWGAPGTFSSIQNTRTDLLCAGHSQLADGRILTAGGQWGCHDHADIFDPVSGTWSAAPDMNDLRWYPTNTTLPDGRVLVTSGRLCPKRLSHP